MENIYIFLKNVILDLKQESKQNTFFIFILILLISIPLPFVVNNIALGLLILHFFLNFKKTNFKTTQILIFPVAMFFIMAASYFWSIDKEETLQAIPKEISLLLIPLMFMKTQISINQKNKLIKYFSYSMVIMAVFFLLRAIIRYLINYDSRVFFYHGENDYDYGLVPKTLNAIHVSVFVAVAFFYFFTKEIKLKMDLILSFLLAGFIVLLSSKNIILVMILLVLTYYFFYSKASYKMRFKNLLIFLGIVVFSLSVGKIRVRFQEEIRNNTNNSLNSNVLSTLSNGVHNISIYEAWNNEQFTPNDYFPGTAFRVYQIRMFFELLEGNSIFFKGFGFNASKAKLLEKEKKYNLHKGYGNYNFHNQYIQNFAELGIFGLLLLLSMLLLSIRNAIKSKNFIHIAFSVLIISLFFTESFLWRQRGITFFILMYCIFNTNFQPQKTISL
jgi:O-antigen ligase